ncbi:MAG: hypothetical protein RJQ09_19150 [Cyclobacteriaceae bacterium]
MKRSFFKVVTIIILFTSTFKLSAQKNSLIELLNHPVGGVWSSPNEQNNGAPDNFNIFLMTFENWSSEESVIGNIYGVRNNGDTTQLMEVWNYINPSENNIFLVQRTAWGEHSTGKIEIFESQHLDITFMSTTSAGVTYLTRDIHYILSENEMRSESFQKMKEEEEWRSVGVSIWKRAE